MDVPHSLLKDKQSNFRKMAGASIANIFYLVIQSLLFIILTPMVLRALGNNLFGIWAIFLAIIGFVGLMNFRLNSTAMKFSSQFSSSNAARKKLFLVVTFVYSSAFILGAFTAIILWGARNYLAAKILGNTVSFSLLADSLALLALSVIPFFLSEVSHGILLGLLHNNLSGALITAHQFFLWCGALLVGWLGTGVWFLGFVILVANILRFITSTAAVCFVLRSMQVKLCWNKMLVREMLCYSTSISLGGAAMLMFNSLDKIIIGITLGPAIAGAYGIGTSMALRISMFADQLSQVLVPFSSSFYATGKRQHIISLFRRSSSLMACLLALSTGLLMLWMKPILSLWISPEFSDQYFVIFGFLAGFYGIFSMFRSSHQISLGLGWVTVPSLILLASAVFMLTSLWFFSMRFGLFGAIYANAVFTVVISINFYLGRRLGVNLYNVLQDIKYPILLIIACMVFSSLNPNMVFRICGTAIVLAILFLILRGLGKMPLAIGPDT